MQAICRRRTRPGWTPTVTVLVACVAVACSARAAPPVQHAGTGRAVVHRVTFESPTKRMHDSLDHLVNRMTEGMKGADRNRLAVLDFSNLDGRVTRLGRFVAEEVITRFCETGRFQVIERALLYKVAQEHHLALDPMLDPASAQQLGKILGVDAVVTGTITDLVDVYRLNARVIGTRHGLVLAAASVSLPKDQALRSLNR